MKLNTVLNTLSGLKPLTYAHSNDLEGQRMIAYDGSKELHLIDLFPEHAKNLEKFTFNPENKDEKIVNVISQSFKGASNTFLLTATADGTIFNNYLLDFDIKISGSVHQPKFSSTSTPMIVPDPSTLEPSIIYSDNEQLKIGIFESGQEFKIHDLKYHKKIISATGQITYQQVPIPRVPKGIHTSSFLDLTGNMHSDLALHTKDDIKSYIDIMKLLPDYVLREESSIELPLVTGPILFSEFTSKLATDMIFVSNKNGKFVLNLYPNISMNQRENEISKEILKFKEEIEKFEPTSIFGKPITLDLDEALKKMKHDGFIPILSNDGKSPSGIFLADLAGKGFKDVFITIYNSTVKPHDNYRVVSFQFDPTTQKFAISEEYKPESSISGKSIHSVSVCDYNNSGKQNLIVTTSPKESDLNEYVSILYEDDLAMQQTGINFMSLVAKSKNQNFYIPGTVVAMVYENEENIIKTTLSSQTSFSSLQPIKSFIGLGPTNLFINWATIRVPSYDAKINTKDAISFLVPNTFAVFTLKDGHWRIQSFFSKMFFRVTASVLVVILLVFMTIFILLSVQEKRKYKLVMSKDSTRTVFNAL